MWKTQEKATARGFFATALDSWRGLERLDLLKQKEKLISYHIKPALEQVVYRGINQGLGFGRGRQGRRRRADHDHREERGRRKSAYIGRGKGNRGSGAGTRISVRQNERRTASSCAGRLTCAITPVYDVRKIKSLRISGSEKPWHAYAHGHGRGARNRGGWRLV